MVRKTISVKNLIALCYIIDNFDEFDKKLQILLEEEKDKTELICKLERIATNKKCITSPKLKQFYNQNKNIINIINVHSSLISFINQNYQWIWDNQEVEFVNFELYYHIKENKKDLHQIIAVLEKIKALGFSSLEFNPELDFTKETYTCDCYDLGGNNLSYLDNIEVIPTYYPSEIKYKTKSSNYKIILTTFTGFVDKRNKSIILNNLNFNPNCLPDAITPEETLNKIKAQQTSQGTSILKDLIDLNVSIEDMFLQFAKIEKIINATSDFKDKVELIKLLQEVKEKVLLMQEISENYNKDIINTNNNITTSIYEDEKTYYKKRRKNLANIYSN